MLSPDESAALADPANVDLRVGGVPLVRPIRRFFAVPPVPPVGATLGATAAAATAALAGTVAVRGTLAASADAATTSLGVGLTVTATAAMTAGAASTSLTSLSLAPVHVTLAAAAGYATTGLSGGTVLRLINWDAVADTDLTNPFEIDPDATTDDTI